MEAPSHPQVVAVGSEFLEGQAGNAEIDLMLGHKTVLCGSQAIRGDNGYEIAPDYCSDSTLCTKHLNKLGIYPFAMRTTYTGKKEPKGFEAEWVMVFPFGDAMAVTKGFKTPEAALACVLWFCLADKSPLT